MNSSSYYAHGGSHYLDFHYTPSCWDIAILPELGSSINASDVMLTFYTCHTFNGSYGSLGTLELGVMTDPADSTSFEVVDTIDISTIERYVYAQQIRSLVNYTGTGKYIAFRVSNCNNTSYYIDDLIVDILPACANPVNFEAAHISNDGVTLSWDDLGGASIWNVQYDTVGFTAGQGAHTVVADSTSFTVNGLTNLTGYDFYVQTDCGDSQSEWIGPVSVVTGVLNMGITGSDTLVTCEAIIADNGGTEGDYSTYCNYSVVVYPATAGSGLQITGTGNVYTGSGWGDSQLTFHDGESTSAPVIATYSGDNLNIAVAASGPITVHFTSGYYTASGFMLNVSCATCTPPANFGVVELNTNDATLTWNGGADSYTVYLSGDTAGVFTTSDTSLTLGNLEASSTYTVQVRSFCGSDSSLLSLAVTFTTPCEAITVTETNPWTESFESYAGNGNQPFQCWDRPVVDGSYGAPFVYCGYTPSCHSGANSAEFKGSEAMLTLPLFSNDIHELRLSFWATSTSPTYGTLEVGVLTNPTDPNSFELVGTCGTPGPRGGENDTANGNFMGPFDFYGVAATSGRIALRYSNTISSASWNLDDFTVEIAPSNLCLMPTGLTVTNIAQNTATATWTAGGNESSWKLQYKAVTSSDWGSEIDCNTTTYDFTSLVPNTAYQVRVKAVCDTNDESSWSAVFEFTTENAVVITEPTVETQAASDITQTSVTLNGAITDPGNQGIIARGIEWKLNSDNGFTQVSLNMGNTLVFTLTGLAPNTCGTFRAYATTANTTTYGETLSFCTLPEDTPEPCDVPTGLYVETTASGEQTNMIIWDDDDDVSQWNVQYKRANTEWVTETVNTNYYQIPNLQYNEPYSVRVQSVCDGNTTSDWTDTVNLMILCGLEDYLQNSVTLFPNPAKEVINVQCTMHNVQSIEVFDVFGKLLQIVETQNFASPQQDQINVSGLADGMYFVRVTMDEGVVTKTFVKKG